MAALIVELLADYAQNKVSVYERCDIDSALKSLYLKKILTKDHLRAILLYSAGYTTTELRIHFLNVEELLIAGFAALEAEVHYTDESLLQRVIEHYPRYAKYVMHYRKKLLEYGRTFDGKPN